MAWKDTLLQASFRGVTFEVTGVGRAGQRAIGEHTYPYTSGANLEDLGTGPRQVRVRAFFWGDDYEPKLRAFIEALEAPGTGDLVHPVHGSMTVMAQSWSDEHDAEQVDCAVVEVQFVEDALFTPVFTATSGPAKADAIAAGATAVRTSADAALQRAVARVPKTALFRITLLKSAFAQAKSALSRLMSITTGGLKLILSDLDPLLYPRSYAADLLAIVDRGLQGLPFGGRNLLFGDSGSATSVAAGSASDTSTPTASGADDFATAHKLLDPAAVAIVPPVDAPDAAALADAAVVQAHARAHAAAAIAEAAAIVLAGELEEPLMDRADVEALCGQARGTLQVAIDSAREALDAEGRSDVGTALRGLAYALEEATRAVINERPPLVRKPAPISGPVRLVAHAFYGDASRASEIVRLNRMGRNVLVQAGEVLNAYSA